MSQDQLLFEVGDKIDWIGPVKELLTSGVETPERTVTDFLKNITRDFARKLGLGPFIVKEVFNACPVTRRNLNHPQLLVLGDDIGAQLPIADPIHRFISGWYFVKM